MFLAKKPKNLNLFYDEKISVYESYARLFVSGNKQRSKPIKIVVVLLDNTIFREFYRSICVNF